MAAATRRGRSTRSPGSVSVEAALGGFVFLVLIMATLDLGRMQYYRATLRHAVSQGTRYATTGQTMTNANGDAQTRDASIAGMIQNLSMGINVPHEPIQISARDGMGNVIAGSGGPGDVVTVSITYHVPVLAPVLRNFFPSATYTFTCTTSFRNEEFQSSASVGGSSTTTGYRA
jgi:Flp pilus assembly protein TadG